MTFSSCDHWSNKSTHSVTGNPVSSFNASCFSAAPGLRHQWQPTYCKTSSSVHWNKNVPVLHDIKIYSQSSSLDVWFEMNKCIFFLMLRCPELGGKNAKCQKQTDWLIVTQLVTLLLHVNTVEKVLCVLSLTLSVGNHY